MTHLGRYLRIDDNPILEAAANNERLLPVFAMDPTVRRGRAQEAFLMAALAQMQQDLRARGSDLLVVHEPPPTEAAERYTSPMRMIDSVEVPKTYTPFRQKIEAAGVRYTMPTASQYWQQYLERRLPDTYKQTRNGLLNADDSSRLSPYLAWGCITARRVAADLHQYEEHYGANEGTYWLWFELLWRDFFSLRAEHLIDHDPASNVGNWRYIAGTGADPRGGRRFNVEKQRELYDADGAYLQRWGVR